MFVKATKIRKISMLANESKKEIDFLGSYIAKYVKKSVESHQDFFNLHSFNPVQTEAIVKDDLHNLVLAPAGSGKTHVLLGRISYLVTQRGISPGKILAVAFTEAAVNEMTQRLSKLGISGIRTTTFHSLARQLVREFSQEWEIARNNEESHYRPNVADQQEQSSLINEIFDQLSTTREYAKALLLHSSAIYEPDESDIEPHEYLEYLNSKPYLTLNSIKVKSIAEREIANYLFIHQVAFEYEPDATWADSDGIHRQYQPDFRLTDYDIYLEHWGVDKEGGLAPWVDPAKYHQRMKWARKQHQKHGKKLIETYHHEYDAGTLIEKLENYLLDHDVRIQELSTEALLEQVDLTIPRKRPVLQFIDRFIQTAKAEGLGMEELRQNLHGQHHRVSRRTMQLVSSLVMPVWKEYENVLKEKKMFDFADMINQGVKALTIKNFVRGRFSHVLVDEFQDVTTAQVKLIKSFLSKDAGTKLFCVGDDWQNIFSFAGSDVSNILNFDRHFPFPEITKIPINYRSTPTIVKASNHVIALNNSAISKSVRAGKSTIGFPIYIDKISHRRNGYQEAELEVAREILAELLRTKRPEETILVLSRFREIYPNFWKLATEFSKHLGDPDNWIRTIHTAKGLEADYVVLLGLTREWNGFPSQFGENKALSIIRNRKPGDLLEEERRLFYVAITRSKGHLFLLSSKNSPSQFVKEILPFLTERPASKTDFSPIPLRPELTSS